jgi:hypothetical protein
MRRRLSLTTRKELIEAVRKRYQEGALATKSEILDEFVELTGYHRKHAVRLLGSSGGQKREKKSRSQTRIYNDAVREVLILLGEAADS